MTPADVHYGRAEQLTTARRQILLEAHRTHPERFVHGTPQPPVLPPQAWINPPTEENDAPECRTSHSRGGVHTWGTPFFCSTKRDLDRCRCGPHRRHEPPDANRGSLNAARECLKVVDTYRRRLLKKRLAGARSYLPPQVWALQGPARDAPPSYISCRNSNNSSTYADLLGRVRDDLPQPCRSQVDLVPKFFPHRIFFGGFEFFLQLLKFRRRCCTARSKSLTSLMPVAESPGAVRIGHPERGHLVEYLAPNSVFNSLPRQRSCSHLRPDDRFVTIDRVLPPCFAW